MFFSFLFFLHIVINRNECGMYISYVDQVLNDSFVSLRLTTQDSENSSGPVLTWETTRRNVDFCL